jgi:hypothetical protein
MYRHPSVHIQNESIEKLASVLKTMFEIRMRDMMKSANDKVAQFNDKGSVV